MLGYTRRKPWTIYELLIRESPTVPIDLIMVRTNHPLGGDTLCGYCRWDGKTLWPEDDGYYDTEETVLKYEWSETGPVKLTYWIRSEWIKNEEEELDGSCAEKEN